MNQVKTGAILSYVLIFLNNIIKLAYTPFLIRSLGQSEFGLYSLAAATIGYLTIMDLGFGNSIIRFTAKYRALGDEETQNNLHGMFIAIYAVLGIIVALCGTILYLNAGTIFSNSMNTEELEKIKILMALLTFNLAITFPFSIYGSIIISHERFIFSKLVNLFRIITNPLIMIPLLFYGYKSIALVVVMTVLNIIVLGTNFYYCKTKIKINPTFGFFDKKLFKEVLGYSFYIFLGVIVDQIYWSTGQFILGAIAGTVMVAVYAVAITIRSLYLSFSSSIVSVLLPRVTQMVTAKVSNQELTNIFIKVGRIQFLILSFILSGFILFGQKFVILWAGKDYSEAYLMALFILIPISIPLIQNLGITILQAKNQQKFRSIVYVLIAIVNIILSIPLAKQYGGLGCAMVTGGSLLLGNGLIMNIYYHKVIKLNIIEFWTQIIKMALPVLGVVILYYSFNYFVSVPNSTILYFVQILIYGCFFILSMWFFGMNNYEKQLIKTLLKISK
ncbi:oligosaccharide flippase family protein [Lutibacter sp. TH_r2]|uniref:oligosaccharide flippase family protein n=1 Tax=Lutibacter sp. TH_r2 TaxID=3082083 RepID=UPI002953E75E|nr:oligosaccharide flippase family protein [Lutibacter sp. TH_r2]MDV7187800.1 oligosaccharide flippase family protein [Lutibacter sp. TH_r2]